MAVEACDKQKLMDDMDEDEVPLVFKRSSSSSSKQNQSTPKAKKSLSQNPDRQVGRPAQDVRSQNGQGAMAQKNKMVSPAKITHVNSPLCSPKSYNSSAKGLIVKSSEIDSKPSTSVTDESKMRRLSAMQRIKDEKPSVETTGEPDEDSDDDKPLSARLPAGLSMVNSNRAKKGPQASTLVQQPKIPKPEDSDDETPLSSKFQVKSNAGLSLHRTSGSGERKPLLSRYDQNGSASTERKPSTNLKKRPGDGVTTADEVFLKKPKISDTSKHKSKEASVKAEMREEDDEDHVPISHRMKKPTSSDKKSLPSKNMTKPKSAISKKTNKKQKKVMKNSKYSFKLPPGSGEGQKWTTLVHNGVIFPPPYKPHGVKMLYKGKPVDLTPEQEEVATMYSVMLDTDFLNKPQFKENFMADWRKILGKNHIIQSLEHCDFTPIYQWHQKEKEKKKKMTAEEKKALKEEKLQQEEKYMWAIVDGVKEKRAFDHRSSKLLILLLTDNELQRWASARRGGMTVLGKVAVPKPLNLPSQRLENHGLDPNVEIVPKGTLGWGSRPSSSGSNPWHSSSLSPNTEGGNVSPSHLSGRPSSGGSGTRPSTAGSERTLEPVAKSWGSNSRPSSDSGTLSSNQTPSTPLRPRSAENRPNSSQLSRFADPVSKSSAAWGTCGTAERLGVKTSKEDGFSLSTGDFPTLGTEKDNSTKNTELDHCLPSSASGIISHGKEDTGSQADVKQGTVNTWTADGPQGADNDIHPSMENWHADNPQYFNPHIAPQHFGTWRGPPGNGPASIWYGGGPRGPPFGAPVRPGGFPLEPFPYCRLQIAPPSLAGSQPVPPQGPRGPHPKNGDLHRPQLPDAYTRPGMPPFRPGSYPAPPGPPGPMAFESFYGPPMGYERDLPYMGMAAGPPVYNSSYPGPAPDLGNSHGRNGHGYHGGKTSSEQVKSEDNTQGTKRVTLKNRNQCDQREEGETREHNVQQSDLSYPEKNRLPVIFSRKSEWGAEEDMDEAMYAKRSAPSEKQPHNFEHRVHSADGVRVKSFEGMSNAKAFHDNWSNVPESGPSFPSETSRVHLSTERESSVPAGTKNSTLMQKIDGLNAKIRVSDGWNDSPSAYNSEERNRSQVTDMKMNNNTGKVSNTAGPFERTSVASRDFVSFQHEATVHDADKPTHPMIASRRHHHGGQQGRFDHRGKGKFNGQDVAGWQKKPLTSEASSAITASHNESPHSYHAHGPINVEETSESCVTGNPIGKVEVDSVETHDSLDIQAQRAKLRESVKQRALQLQKEEEERTREQRAKALAKLEELNRRTLSGEAVSEKADKGEVSNAFQEELQEPHIVDVQVMADYNDANQFVESVELSKNLPVESNVSTWPEHEDGHDNSVENPEPQYINSKHKRTSYKQKQSNPLQRSFTEKPVFNVVVEPQKDHTSGETKLSESTMPNASDTVVEPPVPQKRKNNRNGKNKQHKPDEVALLPPVESTNINPGKDSIENFVAKDTLSDWDSAFSVEPDKFVQAHEVLSSSPNEESHTRVSNQWKSHPSRRLPRNQQANNKVHGGDNTAVWAPVRTQNKARVPVEASPNPVQESTNSMKSTNNNNDMEQNSLKGKRAEMERYVPKPVAKELAQQVNVPNLSSSVTSCRTNEWSMGDVNEGDICHNKHRKDQGTWKQRGPLADSSHVEGAHSTSEPTKEIQQSKEIIGQSMKSEVDSVNAGDDYNLPNKNITTGKYTSVKDQGVTGDGKRNGPKNSAASTGNNNNSDHEKTFSSEVDMNQMNRTKENRASCHWQPKSSSNTTNNQQHGNRTGFSTTETKRLTKREHPQHKAAQGGNLTLPGQSVNVKSNINQGSTVGHRQEFEKRAKAQPYLPNQDPVCLGELPPAAPEDVCVDRNAPSGSRRNSRQSNCSGRGYEPRGEWVSGHDNRPHNGPSFGDSRQRQKLHYEYQPIGPFKGNRSEEPADETDSMNKIHRERGQGQYRRGGNFNRRQSAPLSHVDS